MAVCNITVSNDADFYQVFQYKMSSGTPINITGWHLYMMLRRHAKDEAAVLRLDTETGEIVIVNGATGMFSVYIAQEKLERLGLGDFDHSLIGETGLSKIGFWTGVLVNNAGPSR
jgi:hypothetical protein